MATYTGGGVVASAKYTTATALTVTGYGLKAGTNKHEVALAGAVTDFPIGVTAATADNSGTGHMSYYLPGQTVKVVVGTGGVTKGDLLTVESGGTFITAALAAPTSTGEYIWGVAMQTGAAADVIEMQFQPFEADIT